MTGPTQTKLKTDIEKIVDDILGDYKPIKIRDDKVIRDVIFGFNLFYRHELNLIDSPLIQRLRGIFQTALALYTYPPACHSRFEHSLGCVAFAEKMLNSLSKRIIIDKVNYAEVRLAALLHDCGHGPFSHGSEEIYLSTPNISKLFFDLKEENPALFGDAKPHEILGYFIVTSDRFRLLLSQITNLYNSQEIPCNLGMIDTNNIGHFILGQYPKGKPAMKFFAQIVNGPFDVDKIDYTLRDGYFTGLQLNIDIERLFLTLGTLTINNTGDQKEDVLCVDISGTTPLEQLLFSKTLLYSSVYHHHKVRAALCNLIIAFEQMRDQGMQIEGLDITSSPLNFLKLDDYSIFSVFNFKPIRNLKNRILFKRAAVVSRYSLSEDEENMESYKEFRNLQEEIEDNPATKYDKIKSLRSEIVSDGQRIEEVFIDFPEQPQFRVTGQESIIKISENSFLSLEDIQPSRGWVTAYAQYRYRVFIFSYPEAQETVAKKTKAFFERRKIKLNKKAFEFAKQDTGLIHSLFPRV